MSAADKNPQRGLAGWFGRPAPLEVRSLFERRALMRSPLWLGKGIPPGHRRPLLIIPGFLAGPRSAGCLVKVMLAAGWDVEVANVGRNSGPAYRSVDSAEADLVRMWEHHDQKVTVIGHSRGGQFARVLAVRHPDLISQIIVVGAPLRLKYPEFALVKVPAELLDMTWRKGAFGEVKPEREDQVDNDRYAPFPESVDFVSIYSKSDGIVDWRTAREKAAECVEVSASHLGLISSTAGINAIGKALSRQESTVG